MSLSAPFMVMVGALNDICVTERNCLDYLTSKMREGHLRGAIDPEPADAFNGRTDRLRLIEDATAILAALIERFGETEIRAMPEVEAQRLRLKLAREQPQANLWNRLGRLAGAFSEEE